MVAFWSTFDTDLLSLVEVTEIPKMFIIPFSIGIGITFLEVALLMVIDTDRFSNKPPLLIRHLTYFHSVNTGIINKILIFLFITTVILSFFLSKSLIFWNLSGALFINFSIIPIMKNHRITYYSKESKAFRGLLALCIIVPVMCFMFGKTKALLIYKNNNIKRVNTDIIANKAKTEVTNDSLSLKLVGFLGNKIIVSSLDNKKIWVINQSSVDNVELFEK